MSKKIVVLFSLLLFLATLGKSQFAEKATFHGGITYQFVGFSQVGSPVPSLAYVYGVGAGMNYWAQERHLLMNKNSGSGPELADQLLISPPRVGHARFSSIPVPSPN